MASEAYVFRVADTKVAEYLTGIIQDSKRVSELNVFELPASDRLYYEPNHIPKPGRKYFFPKGPFLMMAGWDLGSKEQVERVIAEYLDTYPYKDGAPKHGKLDVATLFSEVLICDGYYTANIGYISLEKLDINTFIYV